MDADGLDLIPAGVDLEWLERGAEPPLSDWSRPLPRLAFAFYTLGGCYALAVALSEATNGLPIELYCLEGSVPHHAYVVVGAEALDARGGIPVFLARLGASSLITVSSPDDLLDRLGATPAIGPGLRTQTVHPEIVAAAKRAAQRILSAHPTFLPN